MSNRMKARGFLRAVLLVLAVHGYATAQPPDFDVEPLEPEIARASDEGQLALAGFRIPDGWEGSLWAAEPDLANPVAFTVTSDGRVFVCETFRQSKGVEDNRAHMDWLDDDLAARTVDDRLQYLQKHLGDRILEYRLHDDRIRLLRDLDQDGVADTSTVYADHFNGILDGTGAGVLALGDEVLYTCIPHLWRLRDTDGDDRADSRESLYRGFGVRYAFRGHDMHGLIQGPDGNLYFSIGDRGYHVVTEDGRVLADPESGAVFRCRPDGTGLEVFATGLRNPQELAFDDYGNLFTCDNNSDSGDQARIVYIAEASDSGWRMAYQYLPDRGPFNQERLWEPMHDGQPAYLLPPIANFADGPSGLAYDPGTGLSDAFRGCFLLCDFRGGAAQSGIRSFRLADAGAFFRLEDSGQPLWNILATDVEFGPDGALWVLDWVNGWEGDGKGRIYRFQDKQADTELVQHVAMLLREDWSGKSNPDLLELLGHVDRRVRQQAQFTLATRGDDVLDQLMEVAARSSATRLKRLHALWGARQVLERQPTLSEHSRAALQELLLDSDAEVRAQASRVLGELRDRPSAMALIERLDDSSLRVRAMAAHALGKLGHQDALFPLLEMLAANQDEDPALRHAGVMGLVGIGQPERLAESAKDRPVAVRLAAVVALRRMRSDQLAIFLRDASPLVRMEAARAVYDTPIPSLMSELASVPLDTSVPSPLWKRVVLANLRDGTDASAERLARWAASADLPLDLRLDAVELLGLWHEPGSRDRLLGMWRPLDARPGDAGAALKRHLADLVRGPRPLRIAAARAAIAFRVHEILPVLGTLVADGEISGAERADMLVGMVELGEPRIAEQLEQALEDDDPALRSVARSLVAERDPERAVPLLDGAIREGLTEERQRALVTLGRLETDAVHAILIRHLESLLEGDFPADSILELVEAASLKQDESIERLLEQFRARLPATGAAAYPDALEGGDVARGSIVFNLRSDASCRRCHRVRGDGGNVGPDLTSIAVDKDRQYLLEAIVEPNKAIAKGYEAVLVVDLDGRVLTGMVQEQTESFLRLMTAEGKTITVPVEDIDEIRPTRSAMPEDLIQHLSRRDIRDLVAYLASLDEPLRHGEGAGDSAPDEFP